MCMSTFWFGRCQTREEAGGKSLGLRRLGVPQYFIQGVFEWVMLQKKQKPDTARNSKA